MLGNDVGFIFRTLIEPAHLFTALTLVLLRSKSLLTGVLASTLLFLLYVLYTATRGILGTYKSDGVPSLAQNPTKLPILYAESAKVQ